MYRKGSSLAAIKGYMAEEWEVNIKQVDNIDRKEVTARSNNIYMIDSDLVWRMKLIIIKG